MKKRAKRNNKNKKNAANQRHDNREHSVPVSDTIETCCTTNELAENSIVATDGEMLAKQENNGTDAQPVSKQKKNEKVHNSVNDKIRSTRSLQSDDDDDDDDSVEIGACSLCHCALDYSDRAAFFVADREEDYDDNNDNDDNTFFFRRTDPYLPAALYDPNNALVYCDSCPRLFHQYCHFVPLFVLPRGPFYCLICQVAAQQTKKKKTKTNTTTTTKTNSSVDSLFLSPPLASARAAELQWEHDVALSKAVGLEHALSHLERHVRHQLSRYRQTTSRLHALTTTPRRHHHPRSGQGDANSQELRQTIHSLTHVRYKLQQACVCLDTYRSASAPASQAVVEWASQCRTARDLEFCQRVLFPFGRHHAPRWVARTPELRRSCTRATAGADEKKNNDDDNDDDDISLDNLQCCVCFLGHCSDENDLILCDGTTCYRAYHAQCVSPGVVSVSQQQDWFCPLCTTLAELLLVIQQEHMGEEWERAREQRQLLSTTNPQKSVEQEMDSDTDSLRSWNAVEEMFPQARWQYETSSLLMKGVRNADTKLLLQQVLGQEDEQVEDDNDDIEDDEEDDQFDLDQFEEERRRERELAKDNNSDHDDDDGTRSSQATLVEMSDVEYAVGRQELAALSSGEDDDDEISVPDNCCRRQSRRLLKRNGNDNKTKNRSDKVKSEDHDSGKLDSSNIVNGKRNRKRVDYRKLNDAIFGDLSDGEKHNLDGGDDYHIAKRSRVVQQRNDKSRTKAATSRVK